MPDKVASSTWSTSNAIQLGSPMHTHAESAGLCANYGAYITICQPPWNRAGKLIKDRQGKKYPRSVRSEPPRGRTCDKLDLCLNFLPFFFPSLPQILSATEVLWSLHVLRRCAWHPHQVGFARFEPRTWEIRPYSGNVQHEDCVISTVSFLGWLNERWRVHAAHHSCHIDQPPSPLVEVGT